MRYMVFVLLVFFLISKADNQTIFNEACQYYDQQNYDKSISKFNELLHSGYESGELYYNLGNAYFKKNDIVNALVSYERASRLIGNDEDLLANLTISRQKIVDKLEERPVLPIFEYLTGLRKNYNIYSIKPAILIGFLLLTIFVTLLFFFSGFKKRLLLYVLTVSSGVYLVVMLFFGYNIVKEKDFNFGIVSTEKTSVLSSPDENLNNIELFSLHKGAKVQIHRKIDKWIEISVAKDKKGWINEDVVIQI